MPSFHLKLYCAARLRNGDVCGSPDPMKIYNVEYEEGTFTTIYRCPRCNSEVNAEAWMAPSTFEHPEEDR